MTLKKETPKKTTHPRKTKNESVKQTDNQPVLGVVGNTIWILTKEEPTEREQTLTIDGFETPFSIEWVEDRNACLIEVLMGYNLLENVKFSEDDKKSLKGWAIETGHSASAGIDLADEWQLTGGHTAFLLAAEDAPRPSFTVEQKIPVIADAAYKFSGYFATQRAEGLVTLFHYNENHCVIGEEKIYIANQAGYSGGTSLENYNLIEEVFTPISGTKYLQFKIELGEQIDLTQSNGYLFFTELFFGIDNKSPYTTVYCDAAFQLSKNILKDDKSIWGCVNLPKCDIERFIIRYQNGTHQIKSSFLYVNSLFISDLDGCDANSIGGWIIKKKSPNVPLEIEIFVNDKVIFRGYANLFREDLLGSNKSNGFSGFHIETPKSLCDGNEHEITIKEVKTGYLIAKTKLKVRLNKKLVSLIDFFEYAVNTQNLSPMEEFNFNEKNDFYTLYRITELIFKGNLDAAKKEITKLNELNIEPFFILVKQILFFIVQRTKKEVSLSLVDKNVLFLFEVYYKNTKKILNENHGVYCGMKKIGDMSIFYLSSCEELEVRIHTLEVNNINSAWMYDSFGNFVSFVCYTKNMSGSNYHPILNTHLNRPLNLNFKVTIIIPLYQRYELLSVLLKSMSDDSNFLSSNAQVIVADDYPTGNFTPTKEIIESCNFKVNYYRNEKNQGFVKNCNKAFKKASGEIVILINSDVELPKNWFNRMLAPFIDENIVLATPLSTDGENLTVIIPEGQNWRDIDRKISFDSPIYPTACTAIGYCLGIRVSAIKGDLFSNDYGHGYGEDSDLHYRVQELGGKSIVIDNLLILHEHGASYSKIYLDRDKLRDKNLKIFLSKWNGIHASEIEKFNKEKTQWFPDFDSFSGIPVNNNIDILFVSPSSDKTSGGVKVIFNLVNSLLSEGYRIAIVLDGDGNRYTGKYDKGINVYSSFMTLFETVSTIDKVISTCYDTIPLAESIALNYKSLHFNLAQGPECLFSGGKHFYHYQKLIKLPDAIITVSDFLSSYLCDYFNVNSTSINYGPNKNIFYLERVALREKIVAISLNHTTEKGTGFGLLAAKLFYDYGYKVIGFGSWSENIPDWIDFKGWCDEFSIAKIFNVAKFYIEPSYYEGLGLLALESTFCGAIPMIRRNGSGDFIFSKYLDNLTWSPLNDLYRVIDYAIKMSDEEFITIRENLAGIQNSYNSEDGYEKFRNCLKL